MQACDRLAGMTARDCHPKEGCIETVCRGGHTGWICSACFIFGFHRVEADLKRKNSDRTQERSRVYDNFRKRPGSKMSLADVQRKNGIGMCGHRNPSGNVCGHAMVPIGGAIPTFADIAVLGKNKAASCKSAKTVRVPTAKKVSWCGSSPNPRRTRAVKRISPEEVRRQQQAIERIRAEREAAEREAAEAAEREAAELEAAEAVEREAAEREAAEAAERETAEAAELEAAEAAEREAAEREAAEAASTPPGLLVARPRPAVWPGRPSSTSSDEFDGMPSLEQDPGISDTTSNDAQPADIDDDIRVFFRAMMADPPRTDTSTDVDETTRVSQLIDGVDMLARISRHVRMSTAAFGIDKALPDRFHTLVDQLVSTIKRS